MKKTFNDKTGHIEFSFEGLDMFSINPMNYPLAIQSKLPIHGALAKLGDAAAIPKSADNGFTVTEAMRREAVAAMHQQLMAGDWDAKRNAGPRINPVLVKLAAKLGITYEEAAARDVDAMLEELMG